MNQLQAHLQSVLGRGNNKCRELLKVAPRKLVGDLCAKTVQRVRKKRGAKNSKTIDIEYLTINE